jgi:aminoglycoside phosphotransferase (APT) family kinase protein
VHDDYRIGNFLEREKKITAILDWELTHFGDPHEDLAWALMPTFNGGSRKLYGVIDREEVIDHYHRASGISISARSSLLRGLRPVPGRRHPDVRSPRLRS